MLSKTCKNRTLPDAKQAESLWFIFTLPTLPCLAPAGEPSPPILIVRKGCFLYILGIDLEGTYFRTVIL